MRESPQTNRIWGNDKDTFVPGMFDLVSSEATGLVSALKATVWGCLITNQFGGKEREGLGFSFQVKGCTVHYILLQSVA